MGKSHTWQAGPCNRMNAQTGPCAGTPWPLPPPKPFCITSTCHVRRHESTMGVGPISGLCGTRGPATPLPKGLGGATRRVEPVNRGQRRVGGRVATAKRRGKLPRWKSSTVLLTSKKWRLQREGRQSPRQGVEMKSDWLFDKPRSNYWLRVAASNLASQSPCLAGVTQSHCNPQ